MLRYFTACFMVLISSAGFSQNYLYKLVEDQRKLLKSPAREISLFQHIEDASLKADLSTTLNGFDLLELNTASVSNLREAKPSLIELNIPASGVSIKLELLQQDINTSNDFSFNSLSGDGKKTLVSSDQGLHYKGYINNDPNSIASFSCFENGEVMIVFSNASDNYTLGLIKGNTSRYVLYRNMQMRTPLPFTCHTDDDPAYDLTANLPRITNDDPPVQGIPAVLCQKVRFYWEATNKLYFNNFSSNLTNTQNYITGVFNQVATMYANEGIKVELAATSVWTTIDPYNTTSSSSGLNDFRSRWNLQGNNFTGDLAMLVDGGSTNNGGVAYLLSSICSRGSAYAYSNVYGTYNTVPTYSWDVEVLTHEIGHNMGSHHTHWCGWMTGFNGACGAIDNCYTVETTTTCTGCLATTNTNPSAPTGFKGSVMSYCHLRSGIGISLANGFGPLPQGVIRTIVGASTSCTQRENLWTGAVSTAWETPGNWSCNAVPDETTDVTLPTGLTNYPVVNSAAVCRKLTQPTGTTVRVTNGFSLRIAGNQ